MVMPALPKGDHMAARKAAASKQATVAAPWQKVKDVGLAALVGSIVTILISPLSQVISFYLTDFLGRSILSIEYAEKITTEAEVTLDSSRIQALMRSAGFLQYMSQHSELYAITMRASNKISISQLGSLKEVCKIAISQMRDKVARIDSIRELLKEEIDAGRVQSAIKEYTGGMFNSYTFSTETAESIRDSFVAQLQTERTVLVESTIAFGAFLQSIESAVRPISEIKIKLSILNRGNTDGLVRNRGEILTSDGKATFPLLRIAPPKQPQNDPVASVRVTVANPTETIREESVGKVEKRSMTELWFAVEETKLVTDQKKSLADAIATNQLAHFTIVLLDQEKTKIVYSSISR
jgi:hypothetical protein